MSKLVLKKGDKFIVTSEANVENWNSTMSTMKGKEATIRRINLESLDIEEMGYYWCPKNKHIDLGATVALHGVTLEVNDAIIKEVLDVIERFKGEKVKNEFASKWTNVEFKYNFARVDGEIVFEIIW